ncbi:high-potential iron-sulfur protein [Salinibaculum salinum]|uniref:high-potential iron-sulfur protein n=1 Tax=Salinibaculum salinum TaxID=3131996 RepID=UPI0030EE0A60
MIQLTSSAALLGLAGCTSDDDGTEEEQDDTEDGAGDGMDDEEEELPEGVSEEEFETGPVPEAYMRAMSLGGEERNPDDLSTKEEVTFSEYDEAEENSAHQPGRSCGNCADYIIDQNGDGFGACSEVEGYIDRADWCVIYEVLPEPSVPDGMTEDELATAEVPEEYRTADSQADEARDPENIVAQEDVNLTESVEAIADGDADPGESCGTCAEFIPDKNGDTWGACAKVEGYIAAEDWCNIWEHVSEA